MTIDQAYILHQQGCVPTSETDTHVSVKLWNSPFYQFDIPKTMLISTTILETFLVVNGHIGYMVDSFGFSKTK